MDLVFYINYQYGNENYECVTAVYDSETDSLDFQRELSLTDNVDDLNISDKFKEAIKSVDDLKAWCLSSMEVDNLINNLIIEFDYKEFTDYLQNIGYGQIWRKLVEEYGIHDLIENGYWELEYMEELYGRDA